MIDWRIYYDDGSTFSSEDGSPEDAPAFGAVVIVFPDEEVGRVIMHGWDWYYWVPEDGTWWGADIYGLLDRLLHRIDCRALLQGRNMLNTEYLALFKRASEDPDFPLKSAKRSGERP